MLKSPLTNGFKPLFSPTGFTLHPYFQSQNCILNPIVFIFVGVTSYMKLLSWIGTVFQHQMLLTCVVGNVHVHLNCPSFIYEILVWVFCLKIGGFFSTEMEGLGLHHSNTLYDVTLKHCNMLYYHWCCLLSSWKKKKINGWIIYFACEQWSIWF